MVCNRPHEIGIVSNRKVLRYGEHTTRDVLITRHVLREANL